MIKVTLLHLICSINLCAIALTVSCHRGALTLHTAEYQVLVSEHRLKPGPTREVYCTLDKETARAFLYARQYCRLVKWSDLQFAVVFRSLFLLSSFCVICLSLIVLPEVKSAAYMDNNVKSKTIVVTSGKALKSI